MAALDSTAAGIAADSRALDALRAQAKGDPDKALKKAAGQFEALFMQMLLKSMRDAVPQFSPLENDASRMYTGMLDQQLSQTLAGKGEGKGGLGLADMMIRQLSPKKPMPAEKSAAEKSASVEKINRASSEVLDAGKTPQEFVDKMLPHAMEAGKATGVPARFILGQAALESGWGKGEIRAADGAASHNLFGIKAGAGWKGRSVAVTTTEYVDGQPIKRKEKFRAYDSYAEGFRDYARLIANNPRYAAAVKPDNDAAGFAQGLAKGGYATDPAYAAKLTRVINSTLLAQRGAA